MSPCYIVLQLVLLGCLLGNAAHGQQLILVSCDGFRYDYLDWYPDETQFIRQLIPKGVHIKRMTTAFSTITFPNHWTIVTGLYQESHGILSNRMFDPVFKASFNKGSRDERWWNASLPIWISARKQGLKSATFFWPGSEVQFGGLRQNRYFEYDGSISYETRLRTVLDWVTKENFNFVAMYLDQPDSAGHKFGPRSQEVRDALRKVDNTIEALFQGLKERGFENKVDVLIVSDHGMAALHKDKLIDLKDSLDSYVNLILDTGALLTMNAKPGKKQALVDFLKNEVKTKKLEMQVYTRETLPKRLHYANNRRTPDVIVLPNQGYMVTVNGKMPSKGEHGFDNEFSNMKVPMFAVGPSFRRNVQFEGKFRQVDIYGLMCSLLSMKPQPNNGTLKLVPAMLMPNVLKNIVLSNFLPDLSDLIKLLFPF